MTVPLVSVVIPTFNRAQMVVEAVESVLAQEFGDFEIIVVDDGSTDSTASAMAPFLSRVTLLRQENRGVSAARNRGVEASRSPLIAFLDSDDLWHREKLGVQVSYLSTFPDAALCHTGETWVRRGRQVNPRKKHGKARGRHAFQPLLKESLISPSALLIRREPLAEAGGFDESLPACEDYALWLTLARRHEIHFIERPLVVKRGGHGDQLSRTLWGLDRFRVRVLEGISRDPSLSRDDLHAVRAVLGEKSRILAAGSRRRGRHGEADRYELLAGMGDR